MNRSIHRKLLFTSLYLSEGAPIGFIWLALPTRLRAQDVDIGQITWLTAVLVLPWTFKFLWAPLIDLLRTPTWTFRQWIVVAQTLMGLTLVPLLWLDPVENFYWMAGFLLAHAISAATQDVAIDAYCISTTTVGERGEYNGWMQTGMLIGRAVMGGGALVMAAYFGDAFVVSLLIVVTMFSMLLVIGMPQVELHAIEEDSKARVQQIVQSLKRVAVERNTWMGMLFGGLGGAAFKSLEVFYGPYLIDRGVSQETIGWFSMLPMISMMVIGSILGGVLTDRRSARLCAAGALAYLSILIATLGFADAMLEIDAYLFAFPLLVAISLGIGVFTAASYALFMDLTQPRLAATQFSAFMGSTNGCESWSGYVSGVLIASYGYSSAMVTMATISLLSLPLLATLKITRHVDQKTI